ncbi:MAG TPA: hypothetical protein VEI02_15840, partial [Planctomycetota bacterium]|nr:hypothetical protein [Planctomycetota bacterium]
MTTEAPASARERLARTLRRRRARGEAARAAAEGVAVACGVLLIAEFAARVLWIARLDLLRASAVVAGLAVAAGVAARRLRRAPPWTFDADAAAGTAGLFAASETIGSTRLAPVVAARAEDAAARLLLAPPRVAAEASRPRARAALALAAILALAAGGRKPPPDLLSAS